MANKLYGSLKTKANLVGSLGAGAIQVMINDHNQLENRDLDDQHPISAITGLQDALNAIPSKTSDITNDGDGQSPFATQEYVEQNGGKIDVIELNGVEQEIVDKKVSLDVDKQTVGLGNVDNTSDLNKPISTATQNALDGKVDKVNGKGLSTNDYTNEEKLKLSGIESGAEVNVQSDWNSTGGDDFIKNKPTSLNQFSNIETNFQNANQVSTAISENNTNVVIPISERVNAIESKIPNEATSNNKLADKDFVNSSIATNTATFRGNYNLINDLSLTIDATEQEIALALSSTILTADNNDYCFVQIPTSDLTPTQIARIDRYKYNGTTWEFEYSLNNSGFTASQWAAINSGATDTLIGQISTNQSNISNLNTNKVDKTTTIAGVDLQDNITKSELQTAIDFDTKVDKTSLTKRLYGTDNNGNQNVFQFSQSVIASTIAQRLSEGRLNVGTPTETTNATPKGYVDGRTTALTGNAAPTTSTVGFIGQLYLDTSNDYKLYQCVAITTSNDTTTYTWKEVVGGKIDSISAGGTQLTIDASKNVDIPYATNSGNAGVVKIDTSYGISIGSLNQLQMQKADDNNITTRNANFRAIVPTNLNFAVKSALSDTNHLTMTSEEQAVAQEVIGVSRGIARLV